MHVCGLHCAQLAAVAFFYAGFGLAISLHTDAVRNATRTRACGTTGGSRLPQAVRHYCGEEASKAGVYPAVICYLL